MAESVASEIEEALRSQPQQPPNGHATSEREEGETTQAQPQQLPNDRRQDIGPKLLKAILNGDLKYIESIQETNGGNSGLCGVTYGKSSALQVVAGVTDNSIPMSRIYRDFHLSLAATAFATGLYGPSTLILINLMIGPLIRDRVLTKYFEWIQQKIYEKARTTQWLKWVLFLYKRRMYLEIATIIYRQDNSLLELCNDAKGPPLHCAANAGNLHMVSLLVKFASEASEEGRADPEKLKRVLRATNQVGETALHEAARSGYSDVVKELLRADESLPSLVENDGISPVEEFFNAEQNLEILVDNNEISPVEESGADENLASLVDKNGISPLYWAVTAGCLDIVRMLIAPNRLTSYAGPDEQTALHAAVMRQEENITGVILEKNSLLAAKADKAGNTPLHYAAFIGNIYAVRKLLLLEDTGPVYTRNSSGSFPVHLAAEAGNAKVIKELLSMYPDVSELLDEKKKNILHIAVEKKRKGVIMLACKEGINPNMINAKDVDGNTPLHLAVKSSDLEIFLRLSRNKRVNPNIQNNAGQTPLDISASLQKHQFTYSLLNPQSTIRRALLKLGAVQNPCQPDPSDIVDNHVTRDDGTSVVYPNQREGQEMRNGVVLDIEKESTNYENMSKSLITGAVLIASATFAAIFTVPQDYGGDDSSHTLISRKNVFKAFVIADMLAFIFAIVSTIWLLCSALSNIHLEYCKFYFQWCTPLLYGAINLFILTFGLGGYFIIAPLSEWLALLILGVSVIAFVYNIIGNPIIGHLILQASYNERPILLSRLDASVFRIM